MKLARMSSSLGLMAAAAKGDSPPPTEKPPVDAKAAGKQVTCRCLIVSLGEGDEVYTKGQDFQTTAERAKALGDSVEILK